MELEALIKRSKRRTRELQQMGRRYHQHDPEVRERFRRTIKLAVCDAEHRQERYPGRTGRVGARAGIHDLHNNRHAVTLWLRPEGASGNAAG